MFRSHRFVKPAIALVAIGAVAVIASGCALVKPGSVTVTQPQGIGSVRVHFALCTIGGSFCGPNDEDESIQYLAGIAAPPGSTPPASFTATPIGSGTPIVFTRNEEVAPEIAASSVVLQKTIGEATSPEEKEEVEALKPIIGDAWPPAGTQGFGYLSTPVQEVKNASAEWSVDADFGLPTGADGGPFPGPFTTAIAIGFRVVSGAQSANRPVRCIRIQEGSKPVESESFCGGGVQQTQLASADLRITAPAKTAEAFVGGSGQVSFPLKFAGPASPLPSFALSATTSAKGGKAKPAAKTFTPGAPDPTTHLAPTTPGKVTVTLPRNTKPKTYTVTLTAATPQGGVTTGVAKLKVTKPKLKFGATQLNAGKGIATLKVTVPGGGKLTIAGKGVTKVKKKAKKKKTLKVKISPTGSASAQLGSSGSVKLKVKATFKPTSGISVSKTKSIVLKLR
jgi:hypothetical protein